MYESRGMQVCEEALKVLRVSFLINSRFLFACFIWSEFSPMLCCVVLQNSRRRPVKGVLHISGDGLRVVEEETKVNFFFQMSSKNREIFLRAADKFYFPCFLFVASRGSLSTRRSRRCRSALRTAITRKASLTFAATARRAAGCATDSWQPKIR